MTTRNHGRRGETMVIGSRSSSGNRIEKGVGPASRVNLKRTPYWTCRGARGTDKDRRTNDTSRSVDENHPANSAFRREAQRGVTPKCSFDEEGEEWATNYSLWRVPSSDIPPEGTKMMNDSLGSIGRGRWTIRWGGGWGMGTVEPLPRAWSCGRSRTIGCFVPHFSARNRFSTIAQTVLASILPSSFASRDLLRPLRRRNRCRTGFWRGGRGGWSDTPRALDSRHCSSLWEH